MMNYAFADINELCSTALSVLKPPPDLTVSEWADKYRRLSAESSARPGRFRTDVVPYLREPMDMVGTTGVRRITMMTSAQIGKSTFLENVMGYHVHLDPCPILHVSPTLDSQKMFSKERLAPMIRDTPVLRRRFKAARSRDSGNTLGSKRFPGGHIAMVGSNAPSGLASRPVRVVVGDEIDRYERSAGTEGDPINLAVKRTTTFWNRIILLVSTPGDKTTSRIEPEFERGDQRYYYIKCPHCDHEQRLMWSQVKWESDQPDTAFYACAENGCVIDDRERVESLKGGRWKAHAPFNGNISYHLNQLYSPFASLSDGVRDFLDAKDEPELLKTWVNTFLGETWEEKGKRLEWSFLMDHREDYEIREQIPEEVTVITAAIDTQDDRLEIEFLGWGDDHQTWSLGYHVLYGDLTTRQPWADLRSLLREIFIHPIFGEMAVRSACIDSGGHHTKAVYSFAEHMENCVAIKGVSGFGKPFVGRPLKNTLGNARVFPLGVDSIKETVVSRLKVADAQKPGYCAFPAIDSYDEDYFRGMTAEELRTKFIKGFKKQEWFKIRPRNEPFDLRVYNTAALTMLSLDLNAHRRSMLSRVATRDNSEADVKSSSIPKRQSGYMNRWRRG